MSINTAFLAVCVVSAVMSPATSAQQRSSRPEFEVAVIKPAKAGSHGNFTEIAPGGERFTATNTTLKLLIMTAYGVTDRQVSSGPGWVNSEYFDIDAKAQRSASREQILQMLQTLLADRFQLKFHKDTVQVPIYGLSGDGNRLRENRSGASPLVKPGESGQVIFRSVSMAQLTRFLSIRLHRDVVDNTGLKGGYDFELAFTPETPSFGDVPTAGPPASNLPSLPDAVEDQLGLRLRSQKGISEMLVIDGAVKPADN